MDNITLLYSCNHPAETEELDSTCFSFRNMASRKVCTETTMKK